MKMKKTVAGLMAGAVAVSAMATLASAETTVQENKVGNDANLIGVPNNRAEISLTYDLAVWKEFVSDGTIIFARRYDSAIFNVLKGNLGYKGVGVNIGSKYLGGDNSWAMSGYDLSNITLTLSPVKYDVTTGRPSAGTPISYTYVQKAFNGGAGKVDETKERVFVDNANPRTYTVLAETSTDKFPGSTYGFNVKFDTAKNISAAGSAAYGTIAIDDYILDDTDAKGLLLLAYEEELKENEKAYKKAVEAAEDAFDKATETDKKAYDEAVKKAEKDLKDAQDKIAEYKQYTANEALGLTWEQANSVLNQFRANVVTGNQYNVFGYDETATSSTGIKSQVVVLDSYVRVETTEEQYYDGSAWKPSTEAAGLMAYSVEAQDSTVFDVGDEFAYKNGSWVDTANGDIATGLPTPSDGATGAKALVVGYDDSTNKVSLVVVQNAALKEPKQVVNYGFYNSADDQIIYDDWHTEEAAIAAAVNAKAYYASTTDYSALEPLTLITKPTGNAKVDQFVGTSGARAIYVGPATASEQNTSTTTENVVIATAESIQTWQNADGDESVGFDYLTYWTDNDKLGKVVDRDKELEKAKAAYDKAIADAKAKYDAATEDAQDAKDKAIKAAEKAKAAADEETTEDYEAALLLLPDEYGFKTMVVTSVYKVHIKDAGWWDGAKNTTTDFADALTGFDNAVGVGAGSIPSFTNPTRADVPFPMYSGPVIPGDVIKNLKGRKSGNNYYTAPLSVLNDVVANYSNGAGEVDFIFTGSSRYIDVRLWIPAVKAANGQGYYVFGPGDVDTKGTFVKTSDVQQLQRIYAGAKDYEYRDKYEMTVNNQLYIVNPFYGAGYDSNTDPITKEKDYMGRGNDKNGMAWHNTVFTQYLYTANSFSGSYYEPSLSNTGIQYNNGYGYTVSGTGENGVDPNAYSLYGSLNYGNWNQNLLKGGLVVNSDFTMQLSDTQYFLWGTNTVTFKWSQIVNKNFGGVTNAKQLLMSMLLYTPVEWYWDTLTVTVPAEEVEKIDVTTKSGLEDAGDVIVEDEVIEEVVEEDEVFEDNEVEEDLEDWSDEEEDWSDEEDNWDEEDDWSDEEEDWGDEEEDDWSDEDWGDEEEEDWGEEEDFGDFDDFEEDFTEPEPEETEPETTVVVEETKSVPSPKTGNSPIALAVIPVALAAAAVIAKKKND